MDSEKDFSKETDFFPLAVVGAACYLPDASSPDEFWSNLFNNRVSIRPVGEDRFPSVFFDSKKGTRGKSYSNLAGLVDYERFCRESVPTLRRELAEKGILAEDVNLPPGHLLVLHTALQTFRSANLNPFQLDDPSIGFFCGLVSANNSNEFSPVFPNVECFLDTLDDLPSFASLPDSEKKGIKNDFLQAGRNISDFVMRRPEFLSDEPPHRLIRLVQEAFDLTGAGFSFDSACSSSLLALELARNYLASGKISAALVGGMTFFASSGPVHFSHASSCSAQGAFPFDARANGLVSGEGCAFSLVKSLDQALKDGDRILGIIRGIGFSSDGRGKSLWAPSPEGQTLAIQRAFQDSRCSSWDEIDCVEAHATSTQLGDATELVSLTQAMKGKISPEKRLPITSIKSNIGHILEAAGMSSLLKVLLCMDRETMLKQTAFQKTGEKFDWDKSPFYVLEENRPWKKDSGYRKATVQAFGIGGLNAQVILEGPEGGSDPALLSSKTSEKSDLSSEEPIAIVGVGAVLPDAFDVSAFDRLLTNKVSAIKGIPADRKYTLFPKAKRNDPNSLFHRARGGFVTGYDYNWKRHRIPPKHIALANPLQFMVLGAVDEAVESAGYHSHLTKQDPKNPTSTTKVLDPESTVAVVGTRTDSDFLCALNMVLQIPVFQQRLQKVFTDHQIPPEIAKRMGDDFADKIYSDYPCLEDETGGFTISTLASRITKTYDLMGGGVALDSGDISTFTALENGVHLLQRHRNLKTILCAIGHRSMNSGELSKCEREGRIPGEGSVAFVLKRLEDAKRDGDKILGVIRNITGERLSRNGRTDGEKKLTLPETEGRPILRETIGEEIPRYGERMTRRVSEEFNALGKTLPENRYRAINDAIGDLRPASGAVAILDVLLQMEKSGRNENPLAVISQVDRDGMFYQIALEKQFSTPLAEKESTVPNAQKENATEGNVTDNGPNGSTGSITSSDVIRINAESEREKSDRIAFLLPGQGSQYKGMLAPFLRAFPQANPILHELDAVLAKLSYPSFEDLTVQNGDLLGQDVFRTQLALLVGDVLVAKTLETVGVAPDMVMGHSYGEYPAMVVAGIWSFETAAWMTAQRCRVISQVLEEMARRGNGNLGMLSTNAPEEAIQGVFRKLEPEFGKGKFYLSNLNAPDQTVISGTRDALNRMVEEFKAIRRGGVILAVPTAYHSPLVADVCDPLGEILKNVSFDFPRTPFLSGVSMKFEADPEIFRSNLVEQMTRPVHFIHMIEKAYKNGARHFVEIGPKAVLTRLAAKILHDKTDIHFYLTDNGPKGIERELEITPFQTVLKRVPDDRRNPSRPHETSRPVPTSKSVLSVSDSVAVPTSANLAPSSPKSPVSIKTQARGTNEVPVYSGSAYELGFLRGQNDADRIRRALRRYADVSGTPSERLLPTFNPNGTDFGTLFGQDGLAELQGMADGAKVPLELLLRHNLSVFPISREHVSHLGLDKPTGACSHFAGPLADGESVHGGNIDIPFQRIVPDALSPELAVRRPKGRIPSVSIVLTGLLGSRGGINAKGLAVTTCDLMDNAFFNPPANGLHRGMVLQAILDHCGTVEEAVEYLRTIPLSGAKAVGMSDATGQSALVEYVGNDITVHKANLWFGTNHAQYRKATGNDSGVPSHSVYRLQRLGELLTTTPDGKLSLGSDSIFSVLRDMKDLAVKSDSAPHSRYRSMNMILRSDNAFSWLFFRKSGTIRFQKTLVSTQLPKPSGYFTDYSLSDLLPEYASESVTSLTDIPSPQRNTVSTFDRPSGPSATISPTKSFSDGASPQGENDPLGRWILSVKDGADLVSLDQRTDDFIEINPDGKRRVTVRHEDRLVPLQPLPETFQLPTTPVLLILGRENRLGDAFRAIEGKMGGVFLRYHVFDESGERKTTDQIQREIRSLYEKQPFSHVLVLTPWDEIPASPENGTNWNRCYQQVVQAPLMAIQEWFRNLKSGGKIGKGSLLIATRSGGDVGVSGQASTPWDGAWLGIAHGLRFEGFIACEADFATFVVDHSSQEAPETVALDLCRELVGPREVAEDVGYRQKNRYAVRLIPKRLDKSSDASAPLCPQGTKKPVWIITGGCRGVTAELAMGIGKRYGARLHLIGSTPLEGDPAWLSLDKEGLKALRQQVVREALAQKKKPTDVWTKVEKSIETRRNLLRFQEAGIDVVYHAHNLSNFENARQIAEELIRQEPEIDGILFGAGVEKAGLFEKTSDPDIQRIVDIKVSSAAGILSAFTPTSFPKTIIGMGSISGRLGSSGQIGYCLANNMLGKLLASFAATHSGCRPLLVHWHPWGDVGMAVRPESRLVFESSGILFMPAVEGVKRLLEELDDAQITPEVCFTQWEYMGWYYRHPFPALNPPSLANLADVDPENVDSDNEGGKKETNAKVAVAPNPMSQVHPSSSEDPRGLISEADYRRANSSETVMGPAPADLSDPTDRLCRFVPRLLETEPLPDAGPLSLWKSLFQGGSILLIGENPVADLLAQRLDEGNVTYFRIGLSDYSRLEEILPEFWEKKPFVTVIDTFGCEMPVQTDESDWNQRVSRLVTMDCLIMRQVVMLAHAAKSFDKMNFISVTRFGGDFGLSGDLSAPAGGLCNGLLKGLRDEVHVKDGIYLPVKAIDHPFDASPEVIVRHVLSELKGEREAVLSGANLQKALLDEKERSSGLTEDWSPFDIETGYRGERRFVVRTIGELDSQQEESDWYRSLKEKEPKDGVWILVGGLRGITNANAFALAKEVRPRKIWLAGFSPLEPVEEKFLNATKEELAAFQTAMTRESLRLKLSPIKRWNAFHRRLEMTKNLKAFEELGAEVAYVPCDTRYWENIDRMVSQVEAAGDRVTGFVFGAGWPGRDNAVENCKPVDIESGLLTKACGLTAFLERLEAHPLRFAVGFSSVSGRFGGNGQVFYTGQNDMSAKTILAWRRRKPECRFLCVEWGPWGDVGMAARPDIKGALIAAKILFLTKETGPCRFVNEFRLGLPEPEALFVSWRYYDRFQPEDLSVPKRLIRPSASPSDSWKAPDHQSKAECSQATSRPCCPLDRTGVTLPPLFLDVMTAETRRLRPMSEEEIATSFDEFGLSAPLEEVSLFVIAAPRQIATLTPHHETERKERILLKQRTMETFAKWRQKRAGKSSGNDRVLLLTFQDAENPIHYNEAEDYRQALTSILSTQTEANPPKVEEISGPVGESPDAYLKRVFQRIASQQEKGDKPASSGMGNISPQKPSFTDPASVISPLLESWTQNPADSSVKAVFTVDPAKAPFLLNHQLKGKAILPLVVIMEAMAETPLRFDARPIELRNIKSVRGMICSEPVPYRLACLGTEKEEGWSLRLVGDYYNAQGKKINDRIPYASGEVRRIGATWGDGIPVCPDDQGTVTTWTPVYPGPNPEGFYHGPILQKLQFCRFLKDGRLLGEILVPDRNELFGRNVGTPILDAAVLDAAFWACGVLNGANHPGTSVVPDSLFSLKGIPNRLRSGETARVVTTLRETLTLPLGFRQALFDFVIYNEEKEPVWKVEGFKMTILEGASS